MMILREGLCPGLTADIISVLKKNHVRTVVDLVAADLEELARKCSLSYKTLVAVRRVLLAQYSAFPSNGADLYEELKASTAILPTGNKKLDILLDSGLYTGEVTEIAGAPGSGKTQMCQSIAVNVATSLQQRVCYIDTTGGLTGTRLLQLIQCKAQQEDEQVASLEIIQVIHVFDAYKLLDVLQDLRHSFSQQLLRSGKTLRLVVVDSVCAVIYPLLGGKQTEGMAVMMYLARELQTLAHDFSLAVLVTNHITRDGSAGFRPALGRSWSFVPSTRIQIQRDERSKQSGNRLMSLVKSSRQPTNLQVEVEIGPCGIFEENVTTASGS
ncbi:DNA repair protein RAD51 homolog 4 [Bufo gargarizans]|uniref:DNA repair protein RAD51 homolog 4 n=1 Tax=Bufo gargarizans TaxID=30331 RepID=UPI001CF562AF|nr:DNA repair protein RAD51 homolog 4 [Bufo gargarizans]XP_044142623.1 DNA repair protein RAD51 homolog 4 [Bufo gargarizans]XP_044142624.1 DNA repair protein RAD51 homolog 4 [Bufo gargarizans]XP_044142625.1 DNA repair protein RAD51 homolog 4 [Bufo gargarizans]